MKKVILVVEDNCDVRENTIEMLELSGYAALGAANGKFGFETALANQPELILCDISMPDTNGLELHHLLKNNEHTKNIPLVFFSAYSIPTAITNNTLPLVQDYIRKPFTIEELLEVVQKWL